MQKQLQNARIATAKAQGQRVYISGIQGPQTLELGVAYHYRGHQIYAYPAGNPIEPIPFSTSKGINIIGTAQSLAPLYDTNAPNLVPETSISALNKSCHHVWKAQKELAEEQKRVTSQAIGEHTRKVAEEKDVVAVVEKPVNVRYGSYSLHSLPGEASRSYTATAPLVPTQVLSRTASRGNSHTSLSTLAAHNVRSGPGETSSPTLDLRPASLSDDLPSLTTTAKTYGIHSFTDQANPLANGTLHYTSSRPGSPTLLSNLALQNVHVHHGETLLAASSDLLDPSSLANSHTSMISLSIYGRDQTATHTQKPQPSTIHASSPSPMAAYTLSPFVNERSHTPHDRARFLADSAPGSRLVSVANTPYPSRPVSPTQHDAHAHGSPLRQIASTWRLVQMLAENRTIRASSPLSHVAESRTLFSTTSSDSEEELDTDTLTERWFEPSETAPYRETASSISPPYSRNKPIGTGRPRRASMALNQAYNAANPPSQPAQGSQAVVSARLPKCSLHGEECDGVTVVETWKTQHAKETTGFRELYPVVSGAGDRVMVDWFQLLKEERC